MKFILFLDDIRNPYDVYKKNKNEIYYHIKNYNNFKNIILKIGLPDKISFDHDLGEGKTGYDCAKFLINYCIDNNIKLPEYKVHSANIVGKENIEKLFKNFIEKYQEK